MLNVISQFFPGELSRILRLLPKPLCLHAGGVFVLMLLQSFLELWFILSLTHMGLALMDSYSLRQNWLYKALFYLFPSLGVWAQDVRHLLFMAGLVVIGVALLKNAVSFFCAQRIASLGEDISFNIGSEIMERFLHRDYAWHLSPASAHLLQHMMWRGNLGLMITHLLTLYATALTMLLLLSCLLVQQPVPALLMLGVTGVVGVLLYGGVRHKVQTCANQVANSEKEEQLAMRCALGGIREVLIYRQQNIFLQALAEAAHKGHKPRAFIGIAPTLPTWVLEVTGFIVMVVILAYLVFVQQADIAQITATLSLLLLTAWRVLPYCNRMVSLRISLCSLRHTVGLVVTLLETLRALPRHTAPQPDQNFTFDKHISLHNICFAYAEAPSNCLHDISFTLRKGEKVGIIGVSGAGKSTLAGVLSGLLPPTAGHIEVDGLKLTPERAAAFAMQIGYVPQTPFLFAGTLAENVAFSKWGQPWDEVRVRAACEEAAIDFVDSHPAGLNLCINENSSGLSGGQMQRVSIARALYVQPSLLIFDEATSSLDQSNEDAIQQTIDRLGDNITCVIIAHRLSTVKRCHRLVWLDKGRVVMEGPPEVVLSSYQANGEK